MEPGDFPASGYSVKLGTLEYYTSKVQQAINNYRSITDQLNAGDVTTAEAELGALVCDPEPEHGGGPGEFAAVSRSAIMNYSTLYSRILHTHQAILARLEHMHSALTASHQVYAGLESRNSQRFDRIFDGLEGEEGSFATS